MSKTTFLFLVILVEGYVVLACELLAIRQLVPFVGSGTETVSIAISAVLLPLAIGYHYGGVAFRRRLQHARLRGTQIASVRHILLRNILSALVILTLGLSYISMEIFFTGMGLFGITHRLAQTALYAALFLTWPVFLLGQTVPLISNYFSRRRLSEITGKMLFFSTVGSFMGSVFSTLVLMSFIGVHYTVIITLSLLCLLSLLLARRLLSTDTLVISLLFCLLLALNNGAMMQSLHIVSNNAYNLISIRTIADQEAVILDINRSSSSKLAKDPKHHFTYWKFIDTHFIAPVSKPDMPPRDLLIMGAGGFTVGLNDKVNRYTYVDIDKDLKRIAEIHFLPEPLSPNKRFVAASARAFVRNDTQQYDFILLDTFTNVISIPMETTTREYLLDVKKRLKPGGILVANVIADPAFGDAFSVRYDNTFTSVFPHHTRQIVGKFNAWPKGGASRAIGDNNILYIYFHTGQEDDDTVYTDDKNTYSLDR